MPSPAAGFFGKLPSAGDFVQRRLTPGFVEVWDRHFENAVAESRSALGSAWHETYHASPVWRFLLGPGACGESAWAGIMGPGADRVGRCFPMVIAAPVAADAESCVQILTDAGDWFDAAEQVHGAAQADTAINVDAFDQQVAALASPLDTAPSHTTELLHGVDWSAASHWRLPLPTRAATATFLAELWTRLATTPGHWCLWWTAGAGQVPASALVTRGLPQPAAYAGFLDAGYSVAPWRALGVSADAAPPPISVADASLVDVTPVSAPAWLPDDPELFSDLAAAPEIPVSVPLPAFAAAAPAMAEGLVADVAVLHRPDCGLTLLAAEAGRPDPRQQAVATIAAMGRDLAGSELGAGLLALRARIMALNPELQQAGEDLIDPVLEDCAVVATHLVGAHADVMRIGMAAAWHWRHGRLQPMLVEGGAPAAASVGDDIDDLLFSRGVSTAPGLGATAQPACDEVFCAIEPGDRLLLMATPQLLQLSPDILARSLAMPSGDDARRHLATAAGLGGDPAHWPIAIIEVDA